MLHDSNAGDFHNKATIGASSAVHTAVCTMTKLGWNSFDMLYKNDCLAAIPDGLTQY